MKRPSPYLLPPRFPLQCRIKWWSPWAVFWGLISVAAAPDAHGETLGREMRILYLERRWALLSESWGKREYKMFLSGEEYPLTQTQLAGRYFLFLLCI
ncbi:hypothetical protein N431DRAFT_28930 [Stipitochalara longipes BDJ]|nr:hypothetical protein N431DRAFT_28930 [Stipitochalara longipes BDJ]